MGRKLARVGRPEAGGDSTAQRILRELERRGVAPAFALPVAERLAVEGDPPDAERREATYEGVRAAYEAHRSDCEALEASAANIDEIQRLMQGFAAELRKLEEGLRMVSAYVLRMHDKANADLTRRIH
jgi:hypothetical protein